MTQKRIREYGIRIGSLVPGPLNKITDVPGVLVGHATLRTDEHKTGVTIIMPCPENPYVRKPVAACYVHNGFGKTAGLMQVEELGCIETPIALTNTLNVGLIHDAMVEVMLRRCREEGIDLMSVNPIVGETNDGHINRIQERVLGIAEVEEALAHLCRDFEEGDVGAGAGTICHGLKGGIGSASRAIRIGEQTYTLGVLVQSNYGATRDLRIDGRPVGEVILKQMKDTDRYPEYACSEQDKGSIMIILATDLPVNERQLRRVIRRCGNGLARLGSMTGHGSGDVMIGFTTANSMGSQENAALLSQQILREDLLNDAFRAAAECTEEAVLNSMITAGTTTGLQGKRYYGLGEFVFDNEKQSDQSV